MKSFLSVLIMAVFCVQLAADDNLQEINDFAAYKNSAKMPTRLATVYNFAEVSQSTQIPDPGIEKQPLGVLSSKSVGTQVGITYLDIQHNQTMGRQVEHRGTDWVHFAWTGQSGMNFLNDRRTEYNYFELSYCALDMGYDVHSQFGGLVSLDVDPTYSWSIVGVHSGDDPTHQYPRIYWDYTVPAIPGPKAYFTHEDHPEDVFGGWVTPNWAPNGLGAYEHQNYWPKIDFQIGTEMVVHMVCTERTWPHFSSPITCSYYRRVGPYGSLSPPAQWSDQRAIDTVMLASVTVAASTVTDEVAVVWMAPADFRRNTPAEFDGTGSQFCNDVWFAVSTNQGADWVATTTPTAPSIGNDVDLGIGGGYNSTGGNITNYALDSEWKAYSDLSALYTTDDCLNIVWNCHRWVDTTEIYRRQSAIFHWDEYSQLISPVVKARWDTGGACYPHNFGGDVSKPMISECDGKLYVLYSQFGNADNPCYDVSADNGIINGELYLAASSDGGQTWDSPQNLTNSVTHNCTAGNCDSENWASMARYGRPSAACEDTYPGYVLDILYINDRLPGSVKYEGTWTLNDVMWIATPCRDVVAEREYWDNAGNGLGECYSDEPLVVVPFGDTVVTLVMENDGTISNGYSIGITYTDGSGWINAVPATDVIPAGGQVSVDLTFTAPPGASDPSLYRAEIEITHEAAGSPRVIPVCLRVASQFFEPESAVLATPCRRIRIFNQGQLSGNSPDASLDMIDDCTENGGTDVRIYLRDGSTIVSRVEGDDTLLSYSSYGQTYTSPYSMQPLSDLYVDSTSFPDYSYASCEFTTHDSAIGLIADYYLPKEVDDCGFIVKEVRFWNRKTGPLDYLNNVLVGELVDWDIPTDVGPADTLGNRSDFFGTYHGTMYQQGIELNDIGEDICPLDADNRLGCVVVGYDEYKNIFARNSWNYVHPTGGLEPPETYLDMLFKIGIQPSPGWPPLDIHTIVTFNDFTLPPVTAPNFDTFKVAIILATTDAGIYDLGDIHDRAIDFYVDNRLGNGWKYWALAAPVGPGVSVQLSSDVTITFEYLHEVGPIITEATYDGEEPPSSFKFVPADPPVYYDISTTVAYDSPVEICIHYEESHITGNEADLALMHYEGATWVDVTSSHDMSNNIICGTVTTLSPFAIMEPSSCCDTPGDANNDGGCNIGDQVYIDNYIFRQSQCATNPPIGCAPDCPAEGDPNNDGSVNIGDDVFLGNYIFRPEASPVPVCGSAEK